MRSDSTPAAEEQQPQQVWSLRTECAHAHRLADESHVQILSPAVNPMLKEFASPGTGSIVRITIMRNHSDDEPELLDMAIIPG